jgi:hypothetical protein
VSEGRIDKRQGKNRKGNRIRKNLIVIINEGERNKGTGEEAGSKEKKAKGIGIVNVENDKTQSRQQLNQGITERYFLSAKTALSPEEDKRQDGDVIVKFNSLLAMGTTRRRPDDAYLPGDAVDNNVEEASPGEPEQSDDNYLFHGLLGGFNSPFWGS